MSLLSCCPSFDSSDGGKKRNRGVGGCNLAGGHSRNEAIKRRSRRDRNVLLPPPRQSWAAIFWGLERNDAHHKSFYSVHHQKVHNRDGRHVLRPPFCFHWLNPFFPQKNFPLKLIFGRKRNIFKRPLSWKCIPPATEKFRPTPHAHSRCQPINAVRSRKNLKFRTRHLLPRYCNGHVSRIFKFLKIIFKIIFVII